MRAGKHVLIEKPLCANAEEAREIFRVAEETGKIALEAFHWRFHPATQAVKEMIDQGTFGRVTRTYARMITPKNTIPGSDIRWKYNLGGGALMDEVGLNVLNNSESFASVCRQKLNTIRLLHDGPDLHRFVYPVLH
jgi:predicted dehydrogenase